MKIIIENSSNFTKKPKTLQIMVFLFKYHNFLLFIKRIKYISLV